MMVYRLDPMPTTLDNPRWLRSSIRECVWVMAESPDQARQKVAWATFEFAEPTGPYAPIVYSPWYDDALATCITDPSRGDVPEDAVINSNGRRVN
jgi:hypothetical protein